MASDCAADGSRPGIRPAFPLGWVHDVVWAPPGPRTSVTSLSGPQEPSLSVHAYSPPLTVMSYYEVTDEHRLRRKRTELTDQPEKLMSRIEKVLESARTRLRRLDADEVPAALRRGALLVDIRPQAQRASEGEVPESLKPLVIERNVLEWRCDPTSDARLPQAVSDDVEWVVLCSEGYTSSLAAVALQDLGLHRATDVVGGYRALAAACLLSSA